MLVVSRKKEEEVIIGGTVVVKILEICGDKVRIGLTAPEAVKIMRGELIAANKTKRKGHGLERPTS